jgi:hypothetical protein
MKASKKDQAIDDALTGIFGIDRKSTIEADLCVFCQKPATDFRDALSIKEYTISGMCQSCQDDTFGA